MKSKINLDKLILKTRTRRFFAWLPIKINEDIRFLKTVTVEEQYRFGFKKITFLNIVKLPCGYYWKKVKFIN
ncbi:MAG: hypothetical protein WCO35_01615 [Candidatus Nomurabacteria bacterium]